MLTPPAPPPTILNREHPALTRRAKLVAVLLCLIPASGGLSFAQTMSTFAGLNTVQNKINATAAPDVTIAVGTLQYCEHANSGYQCWSKATNQPVRFFGNINAKSDSFPWTQNTNNNGNTTHCGTAFTPNSQFLHDNVYNRWILERRVTAAGGGHNYMCLAISNIEDFSDPSFAWFAMEYDLDLVIPKNAQGNFYYPDYPQAGLWQTSTTTTPPYTAAKDQALWISYDLQDVNNQSNINGVLLCAADLAGLRASTASPWVNNSKTPACVVAHSLSTFNQRRSWVPANNTDTTPPIAADGEMFTYMIEPPKDTHTYLTDPNHTQAVEQWTIDWTAGTPKPTLVNSWDLPSTQAGGDQLGCFNPGSYYNTVCIPQPSTSATGVKIDSVADRMQQFFQYTSNGGQGSIWTSSHAIQIVPNASNFTQTEADVRVLQRHAAAPNAVFVAGDYPIVDPADGTAYVFLPSIVRDKSGNLQGILGVSGAGVNQHPGLDSLNFNPGTQTSSTYGYIASPITDADAQGTDNLAYRWGDWYSAVLDPTDGCTVWVAGEYLPSTRTTTPFWYSQLAKLPPASTCADGPVLLSNVAVNFGNQQVDVRSNAIVETVTNNQSSTLNISNIFATGDFSQTNTCQQPVAAHASCTISLFFTPSSTGTRTGSLTITDDANNSPQTVALAGIGASAALTVAPSALTFGSQVINTSSAGQTITVTNAGFTNVTINSVQASGGFTDIDNCGGNILTPGSHCTATISFAPVVTGAYSGTVTINDNAPGAPHVVTTTGTSLLAVSLSANLSFPATNVGSSSAPQTMTLTNNQSQILTFTWATSGDFTAVGNGTAPCNGTLAAKAKCTFGVTFTPTFNGQIKGALTITHNAGGSPSSGGLMGNGQNGLTPPLTFSPANLSYGNVVLNTSISKTVTIKNTGATAINISSVTGSGPYVVTPSGTTPCGGNLNANKSCTVTVTFTPLVTGTIIGGVTVVDNASISTQVQNASGNGILAATMSPTSISFGTVAVGNTSSVHVVTVTNNLLTAVPINSVIASGGFVSTTGGSLPCGVNIPANSICTLGVAFSPTVTGAITGDLTLSYGAVSSPQVVTLSGTGN